jgi:voltage-gated potassium channel
LGRGESVPAGEARARPAGARCRRGVVGCVAFGLGPLAAFYETVVTITTVGATTPRQLAGRGGEVFLIVLILLGVGTALYAFSSVLELFIEGHMRDLVKGRRMESRIGSMSDHVIVCGLGRVGREVSSFLANAGRQVVVVDRDGERLAQVGLPGVQGDVTDDSTLERAGIARAGTLVAALDTDADNLYVTLSSRTLRPDIQIIARARSDSSEPKLRRAGADRVVNPQQLGGDRMAAFVTQSHVVDFIDVVMHDGSLEFRLEEFTVAPRSALAGSSIGAMRLRDRTGALVLAVRKPDGSFVTNPSAEHLIDGDDVLIGVGTAEQLHALGALVGQH